ncbi:MAG: phenylacetate-CoA oxygenase subunit PaaI [Proteobacteria bacterium]|nr:MAG: phenylacetate-CoA oxygenase subunit PaaI [Pseudomonadota bacterium]
MKFQDLDAKGRSDLFEYLLRLGDDRLVLGHRLSEWCGHAPILEEDIALANIALDCVGQASAWLALAGQVEGAGRSEDDLAYQREATDFRNVLLVEQPNGDFGYTIARQFLFDCYVFELYTAIGDSTVEEVAALAAKGLKEVRYHLRHSGEWVVRLGDGTAESRRRVAAGFEDLWRFTGELFESDQLEERLASKGIAPLSRELKVSWESRVKEVLKEATLQDLKLEPHMIPGSRQGRHSEHLGHLLSEMQILQRSFPGAKW